jgi:ribosomal protein L11 methyltransferase
MSWCAVDVTSPSDIRDAISTWLVGRTGQAVEERDDGTLVSFAEHAAGAGALLTALQEAFGPCVAGIVRPLPAVDWTEQWRAGLGARTIGRLVVTPSWALPPESTSPTVIIDPESAFGTGEHGSTRTALSLLDRHLVPGGRVLDLGSGSGILAIAAVRLGAVRATGIEVDDEVEPIARGNALRNGVGDRVTFVTGDAAALAPLLGPVELILSNILRSVNVSLLPAIRQSLVPGGIAIFAGMELPEREGFLPLLLGAGFTPVDEAVDDAWWGVAASVA